MNLTAVKRAKGNTERSACRILRQLASAVPADHAIVELGAYRGRTTGWLAFGAAEGAGAQVFAVDPWDRRTADDWPDGYADHLAFDTYGRSETYSDFLAHIEACDADVVALRDFADTVGRTWDHGPVGLLYHDAEHTASAVERDLTVWLPHMARRCVVALHDAGNPNFGVQQGAEMLADHGFDWSERKMCHWSKHPERRGLLVVHRR